jgi:hypothetical protein
VSWKRRSWTSKVAQKWRLYLSKQLPSALTPTSRRHQKERAWKRIAACSIFYSLGRPNKTPTSICFITSTVANAPFFLSWKFPMVATLGGVDTLVSMVT